MVRGEINKKAAYIQARSFMAKALEINGEERQAEGKAKVVRGKDSPWKRSKIARNLFHWPRGPSRTRVRSWKHQWLLVCPVKLRRIVGVVYPTKLKQNLRVFWKLMNPRECVWEIRYRIITKTMLQRWEFITALQFGPQVSSYVSCYENSGSKSSGGQRMGKIGENFGVELDKSKVRNRWSMKQGRRALQFILHH